MNDAETLLSECLASLASEAEIVDVVGAARVRGRRLARRRHAVTGAVAVSAVATTGVAAVAVGDRHGGRASESVTVGSVSSKAAKVATGPTPMATSTFDTTSGSYAALEPACPSGQLPNLKADHDEAVDPHTVVMAPPGQDVVMSLNSQQFLVEGAAPPAGAHWVLAWNGAGPADISILSLNGGGGFDPFGTTGFNATYTGCEPNPGL
jgi:hypothetical protein